MLKSYGPSYRNPEKSLCAVFKISGWRSNTFRQWKNSFGSNQENAAYPSGLCAERVAVFQAGAIYPDAKILKMAITAASEPIRHRHQFHLVALAGNPLPNMNSSRKHLSKFILWEKREAVYKSDSLKNLLPFMFDKNFL